MKKSIFTLAAAVVLSITSMTAQKLVDKTGHINIFSHTSMEDISADNYKVTSTIDPTTGAVIFVVPMQSFEFEKAAMQKHFNSAKHLDTKQFPKAKFKGKITNLSAINFSKDGTYDATVEGTMEMHGKTKKITENGTITIKGGTITVNTVMTITLKDYGVGYEKGKPSTNIAKTIKTTVKTEYKK